MACNCKRNRPYTPTTSGTQTLYVIRDQDGTHEFTTLDEANTYKNEHPTAGVIVRRN